VLGRLLKLFSNEKIAKSGGVAKSRLHFVLVQDRAGLGSEEIAKFKRELVAVIEKYFVIDEKAFDITYRRENDSTTLQINSPILVKKKEEVEQSITSETQLPPTGVSA
jgi:cell division topological specificity factor